MNHVLTNLTAHAESMTVTALILAVVLGKVIQHLSKRLSQYRLTLQTDSFDLRLQTKQHLSQQESLQQEQPGVDNYGNGDNDDGGIPPTTERPQF